uniref:Core-binding factor subunit beta n=2 Tax=Dasyuridae TaxID=9277 RepID=A0A7N4V2R7_SARHA
MVRLVCQEFGSRWAGWGGRGREEAEPSRRGMARGSQRITTRRGRRDRRERARARRGGKRGVPLLWGSGRGSRGTWREGRGRWAGPEREETKDGRSLRGIKGRSEGNGRDLRESQKGRVLWRRPTKGAETRGGGGDAGRGRGRGRGRGQRAGAEGLGEEGGSHRGGGGGGGRGGGALAQSVRGAGNGHGGGCWGVPRSHPHPHLHAREPAGRARNKEKPRGRDRGRPGSARSGRRHSGSPTPGSELRQAARRRAGARLVPSAAPLPPLTGPPRGEKMPRVVPDQKSKFENEEFFRKLSRECEIKYTGFRDRPHEERQARFQNACRDGRSEIAFVATGTNLSLQFFPASWQGEQRQTPSREYVDLEREAGKVYLKAPMILNGVCVIWKGWIDLQRLDGMGCLEFDEERAQQEDALAQQAFEEARRRTREFEDRDRSHREEMEIL